MPLYRVTGWIQQTNPISIVVTAATENDAYNKVYYDHDNVDNSFLDVELLYQEDSENPNST
jgi:hypothetical protein